MYLLFDFGGVLVDLDRQRLGKAVSGGIDQADRSTIPPRRQQRQTSLRRRIDEAVGGRAIGIDDGISPIRQQFLKKPQLGSNISLDRQMIIEMIPPDVGKPGCAQSHAVQAVLCR